MGRTPVYSLFVGLFAEGDTLNVLPIALVQILLRALLITLILAMQLPGRIGKVDWRVAAAALVALDFPSAGLALQVLTETFSSFLLVLSLWMYLWWRRSRRLQWLAGTGLIAGAAALTHPLNVFFLALLVALAAWDVRRLSRHSRGVALAVLLAAGLLFPAAWILRNYAWSGKTIFSLTRSKTLEYRAAGIIAEREGRSIEEVYSMLRAQEETLAYSEGLTAWEVAVQREAQAWKIIRSNPVIYLRLMAAGFLRELLGPGREMWAGWAAASHVGGKGWWAKLFTAVSLLHLAALYLFAVAGLIRTDWQRFPWLGLWCLAIFVMILVAAAGPESYSRFRVPVMPFLAIGVVLLWARAPSATVRRSRKALSTVSAERLS
jgi:4-amino-4-deoxy-L-arabinose transferase-like glycosyltransferase